MEKYIKTNLTLISFTFIPIFYLWDPNWLGFLGVQPYWPLFWLLPWSLIHGSINGLLVGLFLGLVLDSISLDYSFTQIPGLIICGIWFGKLSISANVFTAQFKYGFICCIGSFLCSSLYLSQILIKHMNENNILMYFPSIKNIFAQVFITGLLAPLICSLLFRLFNSSKERDKLINFKNN